MFSLENITRFIHEWLISHFNPTVALFTEFMLVGIAVHYSVCVTGFESWY